MVGLFLDWLDISQHVSLLIDLLWTMEPSNDQCYVTSTTRYLLLPSLTHQTMLRHGRNGVQGFLLRSLDILEVMFPVSG